LEILSIKEWDCERAQIVLLGVITTSLMVALPPRSCSADQEPVLLV
jgi:hypothetical protein